MFHLCSYIDESACFDQTINPILFVMVIVCDVINDEYFYSLSFVAMCHESMSSSHGKQQHICQSNIILKHIIFTVKAIFGGPECLHC